MRAFPTNIHHVKQKQIGACVFPEEKEEEGSGFGYESLHVQTFVFFVFAVPPPPVTPATALFSPRLSPSSTHSSYDWPVPLYKIHMRKWPLPHQRWLLPLVPVLQFSLRI